MTMATVQGAARQSWKPDNPRALLLGLLDRAADPHDRPVIYTEFLEACLSATLRKERLIVNVFDYWFDNNYRSAVRAYPVAGQTTEAQRERLEAKRVEHERAVEARRSQFKAVIEKKADEKAVLLLATMMPIGKTFGDCTGSEVRGMREHLPKALDAVIAKVGDNVLVRSVLTNKQLAKMALRLR